MSVRDELLAYLAALTAGYAIAQQAGHVGWFWITFLAVTVLFKICFPKSRLAPEAEPAQE